MAAVAPLCQPAKQVGWRTRRRRESHGPSRIESAKFSSTGTSPDTTAASRHAIVCRAAERRAGSHANRTTTEDSVTEILTDVIQHCFNKECDDVREKVVDQMGNGLAALVRVSMGVAAGSSPAPGIANNSYYATIEKGDLEQVRRLLQLTSLPFHNAYEEELKELVNLLQADQAGGPGRQFTGREMSQICERIGSDLVQCLGPLAMCFPELPLWAKHRALVLPAEVAAKVVLNLIAGPKRSQVFHSKPN